MPQLRNEAVYLEHDKGQLPEGEMERHEDVRTQAGCKEWVGKKGRKGKNRKKKVFKPRLALPRCRRARFHICPYGFVIPSN